MRIVVHDYAGHAFPIQLSRELAARGHDVLHLYSGSFVAPHGPLEHQPNDPDTLAIEPIMLDRMIDKSAWVRRRFLEVEYGRRLASRIDASRPDVILSANTPLDSQERLLRLARHDRIPFVNWVQDAYGTAADRILRRRLGVIGAVVGPRYIRAEGQQLLQSDRVVVISDDFLPICAAAGVPTTQVDVIPNWAPLSEIPVRPHNNAWSRMHGLARTTNLVYAGTLGMKHDPGLLVALARALRPRSEARVVIVSEGEGVDWLARTSQAEGLTNVLVLPFQDHAVFPDVLGSADTLVAILEPDAATFSVPSKVLSYLCAGRALLLAVPSANLAARTVVEAGAGIVVSPDGTEDFVGAAQRLLDDTALRQVFGTSARRYAEATFRIGAIGDQFEDVLTRVRDSRAVQL